MPWFLFFFFFKFCSIYYSRVASFSSLLTLHRKVSFRTTTTSKLSCVGLFFFPSSNKRISLFLLITIYCDLWSSTSGVRSKELSKDNKKKHWREVSFGDHGNVEASALFRVTATWWTFFLAHSIWISDSQLILPTVNTMSENHQNQING